MQENYTCSLVQVVTTIVVGHSIQLLTKVSGGGVLTRVYSDASADSPGIGTVKK